MKFIALDVTSEKAKEWLVLLSVGGGTIKGAMIRGSGADNAII